MKVLMISDTHHGCHSNDDYFVDKQLKYLDELITKIDDDVDTIIFTGDFFDKKTLVDKRIAVIFWKKWNELINANGIKRKFFIIPGNHDHYYKTSNQFHMLDMMFPDAIIVDERVIVHDRFVLTPWINKNNRSDILKSISEHNLSGNILCGHFDKSGANMTATYVSEADSMPTQVYNNYELIYSGHYHINQAVDNGRWFFIGAPWEINRGDETSVHGAYVFDTNKNAHEFIANTNTIYRRTTITEDECIDKRSIKKLLTDISGMIADIHVETHNIKVFEKVSEIAMDLEPHKLKISYDVIEVDVDDVVLPVKHKSEGEVVKAFLDDQDAANDTEKKIIGGIFMKYFRR
jgi:DNA repair exonuclease SbcCD nuclease subunit